MNIYDKANYRNLLYTIDLDEDDDINVLKYKILEKMNEKEHTFSGGINEINIFNYIINIIKH